MAPRARSKTNGWHTRRWRARRTRAHAKTAGAHLVLLVHMPGQHPTPVTSGECQSVRGFPGEERDSRCKNGGGLIIYTREEATMAGSRVARHLATLRSSRLFGRRSTARGLLRACGRASEPSGGGFRSERGPHALSRTRRATIEAWARCRATPRPSSVQAVDIPATDSAGSIRTPRFELSRNRCVNTLSILLNICLFI